MSEESKNIKVIQTEIHNWKSISDLKIKMDGMHVFLIGDNEVGKTSAIQALIAACGGNIPPDAIKHGEESASIETQFSDGSKTIIKINKSGSKYSMIFPDGLRDDRKSTIQNTFGGVDFDIEQFAAWSKTAEGRRQQVDLIRKILPEETKKQYDRYTHDIASKEATRTEVNRVIGELAAVMKSLKIEQYDLETYAEPKSSETILQKISDAEAYKASYEKVINFVNVSQPEKIASLENKVKEDETELERLKKLIAELEPKIAAAKKSVTEEKNKLESGKIWLTALVEDGKGVMVLQNPVPDASALETAKTELKTLDEHNSRNADVVKYNAESVKWTAKKQESDKLTVQIEESKKLRRDLVANNPNIPIEGLWFDDKQVFITRNGEDFPLDEDVLSTSTVMEIGIRLAFALDNPLKVVYIGRGESVGAKRLKIIDELARKYGFQVFVENVLRGKEELQVVVTENLA